MDALSPNDKYTLNIVPVEEAIPASKEALAIVKGMIKGKALTRMKRDTVNCPIKNQQVSFIECFACPNFNRRVIGKVGCAGLPLDRNT